MNFQGEGAQKGPAATAASRAAAGQRGGRAGPAGPLPRRHAHRGPAGRGADAGGGQEVGGGGRRGRQQPISNLGTFILLLSQMALLFKQIHHFCYCRLQKTKDLEGASHIITVHSGCPIWSETWVWITWIWIFLHITLLCTANSSKFASALGQTNVSQNKIHPNPGLRPDRTPCFRNPRMSMQIQRAWVNDKSRSQQVNM